MSADFSRAVIRWQKRAGRHDLPWQQAPADPYRVWLAEIMLQQTQVATVIPYYERFLARFPDLARLAAADDESVMQLWSGLGYYARARHLLKAARRVVEQHDGRFPRQAAAIEALPGIGRSTAGAIRVFAFGERAAILDGNVRRLLTRVFGIAGTLDQPDHRRALWALAEDLLPQRDIRAYTQGLMDLGATLCRPRNPDCARCPLARLCVARRTDRIDALPQRRAPAPRRQLTLDFLVLLWRGQVLLVERPARGLWGGLLCLPLLDKQPLENLFSGRLACSRARRQSLPEFDHALTHRQLRIRPHLQKVSARNTAPQTIAGVWWRLDALAEAPLPTPIRRILADSSVVGDRHGNPHP